MAPPIRVLGNGIVDFDRREQGPSLEYGNIRLQSWLDYPVLYSGLLIASLFGFFCVLEALSEELVGPKLPDVSLDRLSVMTM